MKTINRKNAGKPFWIPSAVGGGAFLELDPELAYSTNFNVLKCNVAKPKPRSLSQLIEDAMPSIEELDELAEQSSSDWLDDTSWKNEAI